MEIPKAKAKSPTPAKASPAPQSQDDDVQMGEAEAGGLTKGGIRPDRYVIHNTLPERMGSRTNLPPSLRLKLFRTRLANLFATKLIDEDQMYLNTLVEMINEGLSNDQLFGTAEATAACEIMTDANEIMLSDGVVYKI